MTRRARYSVCVAVLCLTLSACGGSSSISVQTTGLAIAAIHPNTAPAGSTQFILTLEGTGLDQTDEVHFGSDVLAPQAATGTCVGISPCPSVITAVVPAADISAAGTVQVTVSSGGTISNAVQFQVTTLAGGFGAPKLSFISPAVAAEGGSPPGSPFPLLVNATNVSAAVTVNFGAFSLAPQVPPTCEPESPCDVEVMVPGAALAGAGTVAVSVSNPGATGGTSNAANFLVAGPSTFPMDESTDNSSPPLPGNGASTHSAISAAGRFVVFDSVAANLAAGVAAGHSQIYLRDNCFGAPTNCEPQTTLISAAANGGAGAGGLMGSSAPQMAGDGRFVVFESDDTNLVAGASQSVMQIYVRDTCQTVIGPVLNCTQQTVLVSQSSAGTPGNAASSNPTASLSGFLVVAFQSAAVNLVSSPVPAGVQQIYLASPCLGTEINPAGCQPEIAIQSTDVNGNPGDKDSTNPSLSSSGQFLSFESLADNLAVNTPGNSFRQIYARTSCPGSSPSPPPVLNTCNPSLGILAVSVDAGGGLGTGDSITPATSLTGAIVFATRAPNLLPAGTGSQQILLQSECYSTNSPCPAPQSVVVSVDSNGQPGQGDSSHPWAAAGGVVFTSVASLLPGVTGQQVYEARVCPVSIPCYPEFTVLASTDSAGNPIGGDFGSGGGPFAAFSTAGSGSGAGVPQVLLGAPLLASTSPVPFEARTGKSARPSRRSALQ